MNQSLKGFLADKDAKSNTSNKITMLNPNAAEFVPFALRAPSGSTNNTYATRVGVSAASGKAVLDRVEFNISNNSDDEAYQYWRHQLPDDITPDFKYMGDDNLQGSVDLSLAGLSIHDGTETSKFTALTGSGHLFSKHDNITLSEKMRYSVPTYVEDQSVLPNNPWDKQFVNGDGHNLTNGREGYSGDSSSSGFSNDLSSEHTALDLTEFNPVEFLASQFPGFAAESLADVYCANACDLNLTIEMLTQLELQDVGGYSQNLNSKTLSTPNLSALDFPALPVSDSQNVPKHTGDDPQRPANLYQSVEKDSLLSFKSNSSSTFRGAIDFASAVRKIASQDSSQWKYERNGSSGTSIGTSRSSHLLSGSYSGNGRSTFGDRLQSYGTARGAPVWLETGEAVANLYSELREEARDFARLRNACFEQASQAYLIGNKAIAKELSVKGQLYNMQMQAAHAKAREAIYRRRNPISSDLQGRSRGQERIIDLHGLHVSEAIHVLKHELSLLRNTARSAAQPLHVLICVGTGHHTKGSRTPVRLPVAVERYLLEEEGLEFVEPQPGMLRVVLY
eukprot:TRINITY_DN7890_c0_g1_i1.p1 TRINITY_DN7890_c0_g1~~TRINITY_DN7890_c0_g1_i1.p1  ORF type:complete len:564 (-),score=101.08 TRINITY_DN7890_c0_g1_i1:181-1872(-)